MFNRMSYNEFAQKYGRDERYKIIEKSRDREAYFLEFQSELRRKEKESRSHKKDKVRVVFFIFIVTSVYVVANVAWLSALKSCCTYTLTFFVDKLLCYALLLL